MFGRKKRLLEWQALVIQAPYDKLFLTEAQLREKSISQINEYIEIANKCSEIINHTNNPDIYFYRLDLLIEKLHILCQYEKYINWPDSFQDVLNSVLDNKEGSITSFIDRYWESICNNLDKQSNTCQIFFDTLQKYNEQMTAQNISYYLEKCQSASVPKCDEEKADASDAANCKTKNTAVKYDNLLIDTTQEPDIYFEEAGKFIIEKEKASIGMLQRMFKIGFNRAAQIMEQLCDAGVVGPEEGTKSRKILMTMEEFTQYIEAGISLCIPSNEPTSQLEEDSKLTADERLQKTKETLHDVLGLVADYSRDGLLLDNLKNIVIPQATDTLQCEFINNLIKFNSPLTMRLLLLDNSKITYAPYNFVFQIQFIPVVTDEDKMSGCIRWLIAERDKRIQTFLDFNVRNIDSYNRKIKTMRVPAEEELEEMQRIVVVVNEIFAFPSDVNDELISLLLNSTKMGIYFVFFSKFTLKNLALGAKTDLLEVFDNKKLTQLFSDNQIAPDFESVTFDQMSGHDFELFCAELLSKNNFNNVTVTQESSDQGIDIIAYKDGIKYGIQCKCYSSDIGNKAVQEAFSGKEFYNCHVAVVLTNRHFTKSAEDLSKSNKILLWDREKLEELIENAKS